MDASSNSPTPPQDQVSTESLQSPLPSSTEKSANTETSHSAKSNKKLFGSILALFLIAGTIGIGSYLVKSRQTTSTQASIDNVSQCSEQGGAIRIGECSSGETPIGIIAGGDGQQLCCKPPVPPGRSCTGQCLPADKATECDPSTIIRDVCANPDEICCNPVPLTSPPPPLTSPPPPLTSPPPIITVPLPVLECPDPNQNLNVKVECVSCAD